MQRGWIALVALASLLQLEPAVAAPDGAKDGPHAAGATAGPLRLAQAGEQRRRGNESVGTPRLEPQAGWTPLGSRTIAFGSGDGRLTIGVGGRAFTRLHLVTDGNSVVVRSVRIAGRGGSAQIAALQRDLQTGSAATVDVGARPAGIREITVQYRARAEGSRASATLTIYGEGARAR